MCWDLVRRRDGRVDHRVRPAADCSGGSGVMVVTASGPVVGGGSTSDTVVAGEALVSGMLVTGTLVVGWMASAPRRAP